jgi:hypothetical protein
MSFHGPKAPKTRYLRSNRSVSQKFLGFATPSLASGAGVSLTSNMFSEKRSIAGQVRLPQGLSDGPWVQEGRVNGKGGSQSSRPITKSEFRQILANRLLR